MRGGGVRRYRAGVAVKLVPFNGTPLLELSDQRDHAIARRIVQFPVLRHVAVLHSGRDAGLSTDDLARDEATARLIRAKAQQLATNWTAAVAELHDLWRIVASPLTANKFFAAGIGRRLT
jgi:hypothetical protein